MAWINLLNLGRYHEKIKAWIEENKYVHPFSHPATMIVQDNLNQFVTKDEKTTWNKKLDADANAVSASKLLTPVKINNVPFDGTNDITISTNVSVNIIEMELPKEQDTISIENMSTLFSNNNKIWLFVDGIKLVHQKHFTINIEENNIILNQTYTSPVNVEVIFF